MRIEAWAGAGARPYWFLRLVGLSAVTGTALGVIGFLSGDLLICIFDWLCLIVFGAVFAGLTIPRLVQLGRRLGAPAALVLPLAIGATAAPISGFSAAFGYWAWPKAAGRLSPGDWYLETLLVEALVIGLWVLVEAALQPRGAPDGVASKAQPLPERAAADDAAICLRMEDHYVHVYRPSGATMELMPLKDAIERYGGADGARVHRSWWVARSAVCGVERVGRNWKLVLTNGLVAPVARNSISELRRLNWIS